MISNDDSTRTRIAIWGGSGSGKTTFLASLQIATLLNDGWRIIGQDEEFPGSTTFLKKSTNTLLGGKFPDTGTTDIVNYSYAITGNIKRFFLDSELNFSLHLRDYPGRIIEETEDLSDPFWEYLVESQGIIYLYNPLLPHTFNIRDLQALSYVWQKCSTKEDGLINGRLKQYLAICIAKHDDPIVMQKLDKLGLITAYADSLNPQIIDAEKAFSAFAGRLVVNQISQYFNKDRVNYYATSAVGFSKDVNGNFVSNVDDRGGVKRIYNISPINVFEPMIWIANKAQNEWE